ncbi:MFS transporter [Streptomyces sp. NPDC048639]|uniref:MFS transporter n=1 Tax=Streptomyces sp. NPDC048639 TaxID=3365581 RepID=UPI003720B6B2
MGAGAGLSRGLTLCLMSLVCVPQLALAAFVPAIPAISEHFGAGESDLSRSMVGYMTAYAASMILTGHLADRYGPKRTQLAALALFAGASALCLLASGVAVFIVGRVLQALGAGAGTVIARLWVQRELPAQERLNVLTALTTVIAVTPAVSPPLAGLLVQYTSWRSLFACMTALGVATLIGAVFLLPSAGSGDAPPAPAARGTEQPDTRAVRAPAARRATDTESRTRIRTKAAGHGSGGLLAAYRNVLADRDFTMFAITISLAWCVYFTFTTYSSHAIQTGLGASPVEYGALYTVVIAGYVSGSTVAKRLGRARSLEWIARLAALTAAVAALAMTAGVQLWPSDPLSLVVPMGFCMVGVGAMFPTCQAGMMRYRGEHAGAASGLFFALQMASGAAYAGVTGWGGDPGYRGLAVAIAVPALVLLLFCAVMMRSARGSSGGRTAEAPVDSSRGVSVRS